MLPQAYKQGVVWQINICGDKLWNDAEMAVVLAQMARTWLASYVMNEEMQHSSIFIETKPPYGSLSVPYVQNDWGSC